MEYIENGDFKDGKLEPWTSLGTPLTVEKEGDEYHVQLSGGGKLNQIFRIADVQPRPFKIEIELRVTGGSDQASGQVQMIWFSGVPHTFNLVESQTWRRIEIPANFSSVSSSNTLQILVQSRFDKAVSIRSVSVHDDR